MKRIFSLLSLILAFSLAASAQLRLPELVDHNMVLQQQSDVNVWGWADPSAEVSVTAEWGTTAKAVANEKGEWKTTLSTPAASLVPYTVSVKSCDKEIVLKNVLVGEVWVCSGQSNMEMKLKGFAGNPVEGYLDYVKESKKMDAIRMFTVGRAPVLEPQNDVKGRWSVASPQTVIEFSAVGYFFARELYLALDVPVGIINTSWSGSCIEAWIPLEKQKKFKDMELSKPLDTENKPHHQPSMLFNGMIAPIVNYTIKGFCWYQGCSNVPRYETYADKMVTMIKHWRELWGNDKLPFYYVELMPYENNNPEGIEYALLREQQAKVMDMIDNVGMTPSNDLIYPYESKNIHPCRKADVAERLAAYALNKDYGYGRNLRTLGPQFKSVKFAGDKAIVNFDNAQLGFDFRGEPVGFEIAGEDGVFHPAKATRKGFSSKEIFVSSDKVEKPKAVRYCFRNCLQGNVFDIFGLPLQPFRSDK